MRRFRRTLTRLAMLFVAASMAVFVIPIGEASATTNSKSIRTLHDNRCLDEDISTPTHNGTRVQMWDCNGWPNQQWTYYSDGTLRSSYDGRCLDADVSSPLHNGSVVQVWDCNGWSNQQWIVFSNEYPILSTPAPNYRCLDEDVSSPTHNGTRVQIWDCNNWNNQQWVRP